MKSKRQARVMAMQTLYAMHQQKAPLNLVIDGVLSSMDIDKYLKEFGMKLIDLVQEHKEVLEKEISVIVENWDWERVALVDRIILQLGWCELKYIGETPPKVVLSESMAIAKKYSTEESPKFINGILDKLAADILKNSKSKGE